MNNKLLTFAVAAALAVGLALTGCSGSQAASNNAASPAASGSSAAISTSAPAPTASASASAASAGAAVSSEAAASAAASPAVGSSAAAAPAAVQTSQYIGEEAAEAAALAHAGFAASDVTALHAELDLDDAVVHYDVEFKTGGREYDYDIDATTGAVLKAESEIDD